MACAALTVLFLLTALNDHKISRFSVHRNPIESPPKFQKIAPKEVRVVNLYTPE